MLKDVGLKATPGRVAILAIFLSERIPQNAEYFAKHVKDADLATIYRTLRAFQKKNIIKQVDVRQESTYYELTDRHHHHIICKGCGFVEDVPQCNVDTLAKKLSRTSKSFMSIDDHTLEFFGLCMTCAK